MNFLVSAVFVFHSLEVFEFRGDEVKANLTAEFQLSIDIMTW